MFWVKATDGNVSLNSKALNGSTIGVFKIWRTHIKALVKIEWLGLNCLNHTLFYTRKNKRLSSVRQRYIVIACVIWKSDKTINYIYPRWWFLLPDLISCDFPHVVKYFTGRSLPSLNSSFHIAGPFGSSFSSSEIYSIDGSPYYSKQGRTRDYHKK